MIIYNHNSSHKSVTDSKHKISTKRTTKVKTSPLKKRRRKVGSGSKKKGKSGKSLLKPNIAFLKAIGLRVRK